MKKRAKASRKRMLSRNNRYQKSPPGVRRRITPENEQIWVGNRAMRRKETSKNRKKAFYEALSNFKVNNILKEFTDVAP